MATEHDDTLKPHRQMFRTFMRITVWLTGGVAVLMALMALFLV